MKRKKDTTLARGSLSRRPRSIFIESWLSSRLRTWIWSLRAFPRFTSGLRGKGRSGRWGERRHSELKRTSEHALEGLSLLMLQPQPGRCRQAKKRAECKGVQKDATLRRRDPIETRSIEPRSLEMKLCHMTINDVKFHYFMPYGRMPYELIYCSFPYGALTLYCCCIIIRLGYLYSTSASD